MSPANLLRATKAHADDVLGQLHHLLGAALTNPSWLLTHTPPLVPSILAYRRDRDGHNQLVVCRLKALFA